MPMREAGGFKDDLYLAPWRTLSVTEDNPHRQPCPLDSIHNLDLLDTHLPQKLRNGNANQPMPSGAALSSIGSWEQNAKSIAF